MERRRGFLLMSLACALGIAGCADSTVEPTDGLPPGWVTNEQEAMKYYATSDEFVSNEDQSFADLALSSTDGLPPGVDDTIIPISWGRFVDDVSITTTATIEEGDTIARVQVDKDITGTFRIVAKYHEDDTTTVLIEKPFVDHSVRNVIFKRVGRETGRFWLNWIPISTSLVEGKTVGFPADQDANITELQLVKPNGETITITDPLETYLRYRWRGLRDGRARTDVPELGVGEAFSVKATMVSSSPIAEHVILRYGASPVSHTRQTMALISETDNGDGTYTRVFELSAEIDHHPGFFHAGVVVMSGKTLTDDDPASYSVNWWGMPYRVL